MAHETDFLVLYKLLGLTADCELEQFRQAYRRRVAALHPDRRGSGPNAAVAAERLKQLTVLYSAAMAFQKEHGRLPGALHARSNQADTSSRRPHAPSADVPRRRSWRWLALSIIIALIWLLWPVDPAP